MPQDQLPRHPHAGAAATRTVRGRATTETTNAAPARPAATPYARWKPAIIASGDACVADDTSPATASVPTDHNTPATVWPSDCPRFRLSA